MKEYLTGKTSQGALSKCARWWVIKIKKIMLIIFLLPLVMASPLDDRMQEAKKIFQNYEEGKSSYVSTLAELWLWRVDGKEVEFSEDDAKRLSMTASHSRNLELFPRVKWKEGRVANAEEIKKEFFINIAGKRTRCWAAQYEGGAPARYECDFKINTFQKAIFNGSKSSANFSGTVDVSFDQSRQDFENMNFKIRGKAALSAWTFSSEEDPRKLIEESFPGVARELCEKNILKFNVWEMLQSDLELATRISLENFGPNYGFNLVKDSYSVNDDEKECSVVINEEWKEVKLHRCQDYATPYLTYKNAQCSEEVAGRMPTSKISFKVKIKEEFIKKKLSKGWDKMKTEFRFGAPIKFDKPVQMQEIGNKTISVRIYENNANLYETTFYLKEDSVVDIKPEFFENSDVRVSVNFKALYGVYNKHWVTEGEFPGSKSMEFKRMFLGLTGTVVELVRAVVSGDIKVEPFWEAGNAQMALAKVDAFQTCLEQFFEKTEEKENPTEEEIKTAANELTSCYNYLK